MIVTLKFGSDPEVVRRALHARGLWVTPLASVEGGAIQHFLIEPHSMKIEEEMLLGLDGIQSVSKRPSPHPLVDRQGPGVIVSGVRLGGMAAPVLFAGPCSVESPEQINTLAARVASCGGRFLRGGAVKPRTSPYTFQGHGEKALIWLRDAADRHGLLVVTEAMSPEEVPRVSEVADLVQIGSRNMYNYPLLTAAGKTGRPVLLKRGLSATVEEWLCAAEYCLLSGAASVILCERGIRSLGSEPETRNLLDLSTVALLTHVHKVPVIVDPSHAVGRRDLIPPLARAALSAGACGLMIEIHDDPANARSDGPQALSSKELAALAASLEKGVSHAS